MPSLSCLTPKNTEFMIQLDHPILTKLVSQIPSDTRTQRKGRAGKSDKDWEVRERRLT